MTGPELQHVTWDQAEMLHMRPSRAFAAVGINPSTVRRWAMAGHIKAVAVGPNGSKLYLYDDVVKASQRARRKPGRRAEITCL